jgi:hypothetical protein
VIVPVNAKKSSENRYLNGNNHSEPFFVIIKNIISQSSTEHFRGFPNFAECLESEIHGAI